MSERDMQTLLDLVERHMGRGWVEVTDWLRNLDSNQLDVIEARLRAGDIQGVVQEVESAALRFAAEAQAAYTRAGQAGAKWLDEQLPDRLVRFDVANERAIRRARENQLELVRGFQDEQQQIARQIVQRTMAEGTTVSANPREIARQFRDAIGLTPYQEGVVYNYRRALERGDWDNALGRELTNGNADRTVARLARDGGTLTPAQIDRMVEQYRQNWIGYRAETIARTESAKNVHEGLAESYQQAVDRGDVDADQLVKEWIPGPHTKDARPMHRTSALLAQRPIVSEPFVLADGTRMMFPGDPAGGAANAANCRCTYATTLR